MKKTYFLMTILASVGLFISSASSMNFCKSPFYDKDGYPYNAVIEAKLTKKEQKYLSTILNALEKKTKEFKNDKSKVKSCHLKQIEDVNGKKILRIPKGSRKPYFGKPTELVIEIPALNFADFESEPLNLTLNVADIDILKYLLSLPDLKNILINCPINKSDLTTPLMKALEFDENGWSAKAKGSDRWFDMMKILVENGAIVCESFMRKMIGRKIEYPKYEKIENITTLKFVVNTVENHNIKVLHDRLTRFMNWYKKYEESKVSGFGKKILEKVNEKYYTDIKFN